MKKLRKKLSWLLIMAMLFSQASFAALAEEPEEDAGEIVLLNDLFDSGAVRSGQSVDIDWSSKATPSVTSEEEGMAYPNPDKPTVHIYYANGKAITIVASNSNTYIREDESGALTELAENAYIYGGSKESGKSYDKTKITMESGNVFAIVGSNRYAGTVKDVDITINGGTLAAVHANEGAGPSTKESVFSDAGAAAFKDRGTYKVGKARITVNGGKIGGQLDGSHGHTLTEELTVTVDGGDLSTCKLMLGGTNGETKKATLNLTGGTINNISTGFRALVGEATLNLEGGQIGQIYTGAYYPDSESKDGTSNWKGWKVGDINYGRAETMTVNIEQGCEYGGIYAGFHILDEDMSAYKDTYTVADDHKVYITDVQPKSITLNIGEGSTDRLDMDVAECDEDRNIIGNGYETVEKYVTVNLPSLTVEGGTATPSNNRGISFTDEKGVLYVTPGDEVEISAREWEQDEKFVQWEGTDGNFADAEEPDTVFTMPSGLADRTITAKFAEREFALDKTELKLDLNAKKNQASGTVRIDKIDYKRPAVSDDYDKKVVKVETIETNEDGKNSYKVSAVGEGSTTIFFTAENTSKKASLKVTVVDTTPVLTVKDGVITAIEGVEGAIDESSYKIEEGKKVTIKYDAKKDKKFTGWSGAAMVDDATLIMPASDTTVTAQYADKIFDFAKGVSKSITLNVDQTDTNTDHIPNQYSFGIESDYDSFDVTSTNLTVAGVAKNEDGTFTIQAVSAGIARIQAELTKDDETTRTIEISVVVTDTTKAISAENGKVAVNTDSAEIEPIEIPAELNEKQVEEMEKAIDEKVTEALNSIAANTAVTDAAVTGLSSATNLEEAGVPAGVPVTIGLKQELKNVDVALEQTGTVTDPETQEEIPVYTPVVKKISYEITPYMKADGEGAQEEKDLHGLKGRFNFRIPVPSTISSKAKWAKMEHIADNGKKDPLTQTLTIQEENGHKYVNATTTHFSTFELEFVDTNPYSGGHSSSGGGSGSRTTSYTGKWVQDAKGWWYQYADQTYPVSAWAYLDGFAGTSRWCHFDAAGYMQTGWLTDVDGHRYYLHPTPDGTRGHMYTGWHEIDGKWYYFTETRTETNPVGSLYVNTVTPDGHQVDADGVRVS